MRRLFLIISLISLSLGLGACGTMHLWGGKSGSNPASFGSSLDIPLGSGGGGGR